MPLADPQQDAGGNAKRVPVPSEREPSLWKGRWGQEDVPLELRVPPVCVQADPERQPLGDVVSDRRRDAEHVEPCLRDQEPEIVLDPPVDEGAEIVVDSDAHPPSLEPEIRRDVEVRQECGRVHRLGLAAAIEPEAREPREQASFQMSPMKLRQPTRIVVDRRGVVGLHEERPGLTGGRGTLLGSPDAQRQRRARHTRRQER
jgi:hypothetical protein